MTRRLLRRTTTLPSGAWAGADQVVSSATNAMLGILVARDSTVSQFGTFAAAYLGYLWLVGGTRAYLGEPLLLEHPASDRARRAVGAAALRGSAGAGLVAGLVGVALALVLHAGALLVISLVAPMLVFQDTARYVLFSRGRAGAAFANDLVWAVLQGAGYLLLSMTTAARPWAALVAWGVAGSACAALAALQVGRGLTAAAPPDDQRAQRRRGKPILLEFLLYVGSAHAGQLLAGGIAGSAVLGAVRGAFVLLGPLNLIFVSVRLVVLTQGRAGPRRDPLLLVCAVQTAAGLCWFAGLLFLPGLTDRMLGATSSNTEAVLSLATAVVVLQGVLYAQATSMRMRDLNGSLVVLRGLTGLLVVAGCVIGAVTGAARGTAMGMVIAYAAGVLIATRLLALPARVREERAGAGFPRPRRVPLRAGTRRTEPTSVMVEAQLGPGP